MIILLSPTKKQKLVKNRFVDTPLLFDDKKKHVLETAQSLSFEDIKTNFKISDNLSQTTLDYYQDYKEHSPAIFTYTGEAFNALSPLTLSDDELKRANNHILVFSALYGLVQPFNLISRYRLDLINKFDFNLKNYWTDTITNYFNTANRPLINLASDEFSGLIDTNCLSVPLHNIHFLNRKDNVCRVVSAHAKKARGAFARALIQDNFPNLEDIVVEDYIFSHKEDNNYYYIKDFNEIG